MHVLATDEEQAGTCKLFTNLDHNCSKTNYENSKLKKYETKGDCEDRKHLETRLWRQETFGNKFHDDGDVKGVFWKLLDV